MMLLRSLVDDGFSFIIDFFQSAYEVLSLELEVLISSLLLHTLSELLSLTVNVS